MNPENIESVVVELVGTILEQPVDGAANRDNVSAWDSLKHMQIIFAFEDRFGRQLTEAEMAAVRSVADLVALASRQ